MVMHSILALAMFYGVLAFIALRASGLLPATMKLLAVISGLYATALLSYAVHCLCQPPLPLVPLLPHF